METKIEVWHNKSSLRKTCVNIPRCVPPSPPSSKLAPRIASLFLLSCPPSIKPARAIYNIEPGGKGGMKCHANVKCGTSISLSIYCLRVFFARNSVVWLSQWALCFYRSKEWFVFTVRVSFLSFFAEQPKGAPLRLQKSAVNTQ